MAGGLPVLQSRGRNLIRERLSSIHSSGGRSSIKEPWQSEVAGHLPEYGAEFAGTAFLVFCVVGAVGCMFARSSPIPRSLPSVSARLFVTGLLLGSAGSLVAVTPLGRLSGAHLNPALSLGFFAEGKMHFHDLCCYVIAQMLGAWAGAYSGALAFGQFALEVRDALNQPANEVTASMAMTGEVVATFALAMVIFIMLSRRASMRWTPLAVVPVVAIIVLLDGNFSGASLNPARSFGPAIVVNDWRKFWVYVAGPCCGSVLAGLLHRFALPLEAKSGKLFHDIQYRSIFAGRADHAANAHVRRQAGTPPQNRPPLRNR